jgi:N-methylhydantoinase B
LGFLREYRILADEVRFSMRTDKHAVEPFGSDLGVAGGKGACIINPGHDGEKRLPSRFGDYRLSRDDIIRVERPGGGGLGDPRRRAPEAVLEDVRQGYVSPARAEREYGIAVESDNGEIRINPEKTVSLRGKTA